MVVEHTWAPGCDIRLYVTTESHSVLNTFLVDLDGPENRDAIWEKTRQAWLHVYKVWANVTWGKRVSRP